MTPATPTTPVTSATLATSATSGEQPVLPRGLIFLASLWLIGAWQLSLGGIAPIQPTSTAYVPGVRMMVQCLAIGAIIGWPLLRLSEPPCPWSIRRSIVDLIALIALVQIVIWPLRLVTPWGIGRLLAIDLTLVAWMIIVGAIIAVAARPPRASRTLTPARGGASTCAPVFITPGAPGPSNTPDTPDTPDTQIPPLTATPQISLPAPSGARRTIGMAFVLLLALGGPLFATLLATLFSDRSSDLSDEVRGALVGSSPFVSLHALASTGAGPLREPERIAMIGAVAAGALTWLAAGLVLRRRVAISGSRPYPDR